MRRKFLQMTSFLLAVTMMLFISSNALAQQKKVLVFSKVGPFNHKSSIESGIKVIQQLGIENNFGVDTTINSDKFTYDNLKRYATVIFLSTTGSPLETLEKKKAFEQYIRSGGGYVGIHSAADTHYDWPWYGELVGAYFGGHPAPQQAAVSVVDPNNIATRHLPAVWMKTDELYNFKWIYEGINVLLTIDEKTYKGGTNGAYHPMAWYHNYDGGRSFYTEFGHEKKYIEDPLFIKHLLGGIKYAMGAKPGDELTVSVK